MSQFAIRNPYLIVVICLVIAVVGVTSVSRMPVDLFPPINIPVVVVATFFSGMPPEQIEEIVATLQGRGYRDEDLKALLGGNLLRLARTVWKGAAHA